MQKMNMLYNEDFLRYSPLFPFTSNLLSGHSDSKPRRTAVGRICPKADQELAGGQVSPKQTGGLLLGQFQTPVLLSGPVPRQNPFRQQIRWTGPVSPRLPRWSCQEKPKHVLCLPRHSKHSEPFLKLLTSGGPGAVGQNVRVGCAVVARTR